MGGVWWRQDAGQAGDSVGQKMIDDRNQRLQGGRFGGQESEAVEE